jgi:putative NIF3 family GTP cyclohydrolase 1 type 2
LELNAADEQGMMDGQILKSAEECGPMSFWKSLGKIAVTVASGLLITNLAAGQEKSLTAQQLIERIQKHVGLEWSKDTVDTFKAGDPNTPVTGIAVTMMATLDVLQRAAAAGDNLIITHEPTFYSHLDTVDELPQKEDDPVLMAKRAFIREHKLVIWRFHDYWHKRTPDGIEAGTAKAIGWEKYQDATNQYLFLIPETTLEALAAELNKKLGTHVMRVIGDPHQKIKKVGLVPGASGFEAETRTLEIPDVDVLVTGEPREWETVEYVADALTEGKKKSLVILGHIPSEQMGMDECTRWLKTFVNKVPVQFVPTKDPFWAQKGITPN